MNGRIAPLLDGVHLAGEGAAVIVVGASLAGLRLAGELARGGVDVLLLGGPDADEALDSPGIATATLWEHAHRLASALGPAMTGELLQFTGRSLDVLRGLGVLEEVGGLVVADDPREGADLVEDVAALVALGLPAELWSAAAVAAATGSPVLGPGRFLPGDGLVDPPLVFDVLAERARRAGARLVDAGPLRAVGGKGVLTAAGRLSAEVVILCDGLLAGQIEPFFADKVYPVRAQRLCFAGDLAPGPGFLAQFGWLYGRPLADGGLILGGARWATPHFEVGETDRAGSPLVASKLEATARRWWPGLGPVVGGFSTVMDFTCDGLPLIGPTPGQPTLWSCLGMNGRPWSFALAGADVLAARLLDEPAAPLPAVLDPRRFV